jgi:hypothetical protein
MNKIVYLATQQIFNLSTARNIKRRRTATCTAPSSMVVMFMPSAAPSRHRERVKVNLHTFFIRPSVRGCQIHASDAFASGDVVQGTQWDCKHPGAVVMLTKRVQLLFRHFYYCSAS